MAFLQDSITLIENMTKSEVIYNKLRHFSAIGVAFNVSKSEMIEIRKMHRSEPGYIFKYKSHKKPDGEYLIWRTK